MNFTDTNYQYLKNNYSKYLGPAKDIGGFFGGPSLHFHIRALSEISRNFLGEDHIEMIYATLVSWGMHRMGNTKTKMVCFTKFKHSILTYKTELTDLKGIRIEDISTADLPEIIKRLSAICFKLKTSKSNARIVGNSKTLAHILPNLVPPIDRQYTIRFFTCEPGTFLNKKEKFKPVQNFKDLEEEKFFSHMINKTHDFTNHIKMDKRIKIEEPFNTSFPKIFDNLIMTYIKSSVHDQNSL
jgi:hypothetical protein